MTWIYAIENPFRLKKDYVWFIHINISHALGDRPLSRQGKGHSGVILSNFFSDIAFLIHDDS